MTENLIVRGVTLVDAGTGTLAPDMALVLEDGAIAGVARTADLGSETAHRTIDAAGRFAVPGYIDAHAHPLNAPDPRDGLALMLAAGITGFRQMSGTPALLEARRAGSLTASDAPALLEMPGEILTPANAATVDAALAEVRAQAAQGADFIKVIDVDADVFFAALAESTRLNLPFLGHLPPSVDVARAARAGLRSIEHLGPKDSILLGASSDEAALREAMAHTVQRGPQIAGNVPAAAIQRAIASPVMFASPAEYLRYQRVVDTYDADKARALARLFVETGTWNVPTLTRLRTMSLVDDRAYRTDPNLRYVPAGLRAMWDEVAEAFPQRVAPASRATLAQLFALQSAFVRVLADAGVGLLTGSDSGGAAAWCIPGFGLHQEFDLLAEAGLTPLEILRAATSNAASFFGRTASLGRLGVGFAADVVLLDADPTANAANLHRIAAVVRGGRYYARADLDALIDSTARRAGTSTDRPIPQSPCC